MTRWTRTVVLLALALTLLQARGANIVVDLGPLQARPATNRVVLWRPLQPWPGNWERTNSGPTGVIVLSNLAVGDYEARIEPWGAVPAVPFNFTVPAATGTFNAHEILSVPGLQTYPQTGRTAWSIAAAEARYALKSAALTNVAGGVHIAVGQGLLASTNANVVTIEADADWTAAIATNVTEVLGGVNVAVGQGLRASTNAKVVTVEGDSDWTAAIATNVAAFSVSNLYAPGIVHVSAFRGVSPGERNNPLKPFASLAEAHDAALPGDVVWVHDGAFNETVWVKPGVSFQLDDGVVIANPFGCSNSAAPVFIGGRGTFATSPVTFSGVTNAYGVVQCRMVTNTTAPAIYADTAGSVRAVLLADEIYASQPQSGFDAASDVTILCRTATFGTLGASTRCVPKLYAQSVSFGGSSFIGATNTIIGAFINTTSAPVVSGRLYLFDCASTNPAAPFYAAGKTFGTVHIYAP